MSDKCWICGKPSVTYIDFTPGDFRQLCSKNPEQGCNKATSSLLLEAKRARDAEYRLREVGRKFQAITVLKQAITVLKHDIARLLGKEI